jgi:tRNA(Ile)-lysidine synthase
MPGPEPSVAAVRAAVRRALVDLAPGALVLAAVSGGADSLALAAGLAFVAPRVRLRAGTVVVDHALQDDSGEVAEAAAAACRGLGLDPVELVVVDVGHGGGTGPEAAARAARLRALEAAAARLGATAVLLGHSRDDQAESVLLGLARGSGARSLGGMPPSRGPFRRPLLTLPRATLRAACAAQGLSPYDDPHNADPAFARSRVRTQVLPVLEAALGPGVAAALARTADLLRADADALDELAEAAADRLRAADGSLACAGLADLPGALRSRVLRAAALRAGCPPAALASAHIASLDALVTAWRGQGPAALPGGVAGVRRCGRLHLVGGPAAAGRLAGGPGRRAGLRPQSGRVEDGQRRAGGAAQVHGPDSAYDGDAYEGDIESVLLSEEQIRDKLAELARKIDRDYAGLEPLLVGVLKGAVMVMADLARAVRVPLTMDFMAVSSYGSSTSSSGVVRILKDLDRDIAGRHVLVVEDIIDSGLTLSWLLRNLRSRGPASVEVCALMRKPDAIQVEVPVRYVGFDIPNQFVVGYGLDYAERYRDLPFVGLLRPEVYADR